jgi:hypothetical protein
MIPYTNLGEITPNFGVNGIFGDMTTKTHFSANQGQDIDKSLSKCNISLLCSQLLFSAKKTTLDAGVGIFFEIVCSALL